MYIFAGSVGTPAAVNKSAGKGSLSGIGEGVYSLYWDGEKELKKVSTAYADNAGIVCMSPDRRCLYAANESKNFTGLNGSGGGVTAYRINWDTGALEKLNDSISYGARTAYVSVTESGEYLLAANHGSHSTVTCHYVKDENGNWILHRGFDDSSVAVFHLNDDGSIDRLTDLKVFDGHGYWCHGGGQSTSHIHCVKVHNDLVIAGNRGADRIEVMRLDENTGKLTVLNRYHARRGFAPRHLDFHPSAAVFYNVDENYACVSVYAYDPETGAVKEMQAARTMPDDYYRSQPLPDFQKEEADPDEKNTSALVNMSERISPSDVHVSRNGKYVYVSNRHWHDKGAISIFRVNDDFRLTLVHNLYLDGGDPRGFALTGDDRYLVVGLCDKNSVEIYKLNQNTGIPEELVCRADVNSTASFAL